MKSIFRDVLKAGALFFAVGVALALVAPPLATLLGPSIIGEAAVAHAVSTPVIWTGAFFGAFGAIDAALRPLANKLFADKPAEQSGKKADSEEAKQVNITIVQSPQQFQEQAFAPEQVLVAANHRESIEAERMELQLAEKGAAI